MRDQMIALMTQLRAGERRMILPHLRLARFQINCTGCFSSLFARFFGKDHNSLNRELLHSVHAITSGY